MDRKVIHSSSAFKENRMSFNCSKPECRRQFPRIPQKIPIEIAEISFPNFTDSMKKGLSRNISEKGICIVSAVPYPVNGILNLNLYIKGWQAYKKPFSRLVDLSQQTPLTVIGKVVWLREHTRKDRTLFELGVEFMNIHEDDYRALRRYLKAHNGG